MKTALSITTILFLASGCSSMPGIVHEIPGVPTRNLILIDTHGNLVDPTGDSRCRGSEGHLEDTRKVAEQNLSASALPVNQREKTREWTPLPQTYSWEPCFGKFISFKTRDIERPDAYLDDIFVGMDEYFGEPGKSGAANVRKVVLVVHGGLNTTKGNIEHSRDKASLILADPEQGEPGSYPIFINWQSNLWGSLYDHLFKLRQGASRPGLFWMAPAYLMGDVVKGVARAPVLWFSYLENELDRKGAYGKNSEVHDEFCRLRGAFEECPDATCNTIAISTGEWTHRRWDSAVSTAAGLPTTVVPLRGWASIAGMGSGGRWTWLAVRGVTTPLLYGLGTPSWRAMERHVSVGFHNERRKPSKIPPGWLEEDPCTGETVPDAIAETPEGDGGISLLLRRLRWEVRKTQCGSLPDIQKVKWEITLIGHSMGALVVNEILREFPDLEIKNIVYMAGAASVRDYEEAVIPYLRRHKNSTIHHVLLHHFVEARDQYFLELPPSGSLLVWIDKFFSDPTTPRDLTVGRYVNLIPVLDETPRELRSQVKVRVLGAGLRKLENGKYVQHEEPRSHGGFLKLDGQREDGRWEPKFWDPQFWAPRREQPKTTRPICESGASPDDVRALR